MLMESNHPELTISRQCDLLGLARSDWYYRPRPRQLSGDEDYNQQLMRLIDQTYTAHPFFGVGQMTLWLRRLGHEVNVKRVRRLMRLMGLEAIYPKPRPRNLSLQNKAHPVYPYLLKDVTVQRPDHVWCADITYLPMRIGWLYLVAIMDWFSRYVLAWELSVTLDAHFCVSALQRALSMGTPQIFNTDQGSQFTSEAFTGVLSRAQIAISMDGTGRAFDNIFIERLWRTVKYEEVYLRDYQTPADARIGLGDYFAFYNDQRPHGSHGGRTPAQVYGLIPGAVAAEAPGGIILPSAVAAVGLRPPSATADPTQDASPP